MPQLPIRQCAGVECGQAWEEGEEGEEPMEEEEEGEEGVRLNQWFHSL